MQDLWIAPVSVLSDTVPAQGATDRHSRIFAFPARPYPAPFFGLRADRPAAQRRAWQCIADPARQDDHRSGKRRAAAMTRASECIRIGTSGWSYEHWRGPFYPHDLPRDKWLPFYASRLMSVELNNSFYRLPNPRTLRRWHDEVPPGFRFAVKASRYITHMKKLHDTAASAKQFLARISVLGEKLAPVLFQLPPRWHSDPPRLAAFLRTLSREFTYAFEFRDPSWFNEEIYALLRTRNAALSIYDLNGFLSPKCLTADFAYVRLHGPDGPYCGSYDDHALVGWAAEFSRWSRRGRSVYCFFDNDERGFAANNAVRLRGMVE